MKPTDTVHNTSYALCTKRTATANSKTLPSSALMLHQTLS